MGQRAGSHDLMHWGLCLIGITALAFDLNSIGEHPGAGGYAARPAPTTAGHGRRACHRAGAQRAGALPWRGWVPRPDCLPATPCQLGATTIPMAAQQELCTCTCCLFLQHTAARGSPNQPPLAEGGCPCQQSLCPEGACPCQLSSCGIASLEAAARPWCSLPSALWHLMTIKICLLSLHVFCCCCCKLTACSPLWLGQRPQRLLKCCLHPLPPLSPLAGAVQELAPPTAEQRAAFLRPVVERLPQPLAPVGVRKRKAPPAQVWSWCARCHFMQLQLLVRGL